MDGALPLDAGDVDSDRARERRPGSDVTIITYSASLFKALEAATALAADGIAGEVIEATGGVLST